MRQKNRTGFRTGGKIKQAKTKLLPFAEALFYSSSSINTVGCVMSDCTLSAASSNGGLFAVSCSVFPVPGCDSDASIIPNSIRFAGFILCVHPFLYIDLPISPTAQLNINPFRAQSQYTFTIIHKNFIITSQFMHILYIIRQNSPLAAFAHFSSFFLAFSFDVCYNK